MPIYNVGKLNVAAENGLLARQDSVILTSPSPTSRSKTVDRNLSSRTTAPNSTLTVFSQRRKVSGHKRGISESIDIYSAPDSTDRGVQQDGPDQTYRNVRQTLRPLSQAPTASPPVTPHRQYQHSHTSTLDVIIPPSSENGYAEVKPPLTPVRSDADSPKPQVSHTRSGSHVSSFIAPDIQDLKKSTTSHLRTLSKIAQNHEDEEFSLSSPAPSVVGLHSTLR